MGADNRADQFQHPRFMQFKIREEVIAVGQAHQRSGSLLSGFRVKVDAYEFLQGNRSLVQVHQSVGHAQQARAKAAQRVHGSLETRGAIHRLDDPGSGHLALDDAIDADMAPQVLLAVHHLNSCGFSPVGGNVEGELLHTGGMRPGSRGDPLTLHEQVQAGTPRVTAAG